MSLSYKQQLTIQVSHLEVDVMKYLLVCVILVTVLEYYKCSIKNEPL